MVHSLLWGIVPTPTPSYQDKENPKKGKDAQGVFFLL